jgi:hypothetical protein
MFPVILSMFLTALPGPEGRVKNDAQGLIDTIESLQQPVEDFRVAELRLDIVARLGVWCPLSDLVGRPLDSEAWSLNPDQTMGPARSDRATHAPPLTATAPARHGGVAGVGCAEEEGSPKPFAGGPDNLLSAVEQRHEA